MFKKVKKFVKEHKTEIGCVVAGAVAGGICCYFGAKCGYVLGYNEGMINGIAKGSPEGYNEGIADGVKGIANLVKTELLPDVIEGAGYFSHAITIENIDDHVPEAAKLIEKVADDGRFGNIQKQFYEDEDVKFFISACSNKVDEYVRRYLG